MEPKNPLFTETKQEMCGIFTKFYDDLRRVIFRKLEIKTGI